MLSRCASKATTQTGEAYPGGRTFGRSPARSPVASAEQRTHKGNRRGLLGAGLWVLGSLLCRGPCGGLETSLDSDFCAAKHRILPVTLNP